MPTVPIDWFWMDDFTVDDTATQIREQAEEAMRKGGGQVRNSFPQAVYVIRTEKPFAIQYPLRFSPTIYIGEGNLISRLNSHRRWLKRLQEQGHNFQFEVAFCLPRLPGNSDAYKDYEAFLLSKFKVKYGALPLRNKQNENMVYQHQYSHTETVIGPTRGVRYRWAIQPLPSNSFRRVFEQTGVYF
jgi:hypothetical protein